MVGESNVGKSSLVMKYINNLFKDSGIGEKRIYENTIDICLYSMNSIEVKIYDLMIMMVMWMMMMVLI